MADCTCNNFPAGLGNVTFGANVGIGTTGPGAKLHIYTDGNEKIRLETTMDALNYHTHIGFYAAGTIKFNMGASRGASSTTFDISPSGATGIVINSSGNVGIGTPTPSERLEVNGNVKAAGTVISATLGGNGTLLRDVDNDYLSLSGGKTRRGPTSGGLIQLMGNARALNPGSIQYILGEGAASPKHIFYDNGPDATIQEIASIDNSGNFRAKGNVGSLATGRVAIDAQGYCLYG